MPPFFDRVQLDDAMRNQAIPVLEALAANDNLRNRSYRRFERDDPPPYVSSTESEEFSDDSLAPPPPRRSELPEELKAIMEQPINDDEMKHISFNLGSILDPIDLYHTEAEREERRAEEYRSNKIFRGVEGSRRCGVLVRHNVKRRWEKLGIWNPEWGFAGRNVQPNDNGDRWKWRWEQQIAHDSESAGYARDAHMEQLVACALRLRQNLRRGENAPVLPQSCLEQDATASQAKSFMISRPWFIFQIELAEEGTSHYVVEGARRLEGEVGQEERATSWKWWHESPSPEPEDLTPINNMKDSPLDTTDMDFTPSEIDDLETIELPSSKQPKGFWTIRRKDSGLRHPFPGQLLEPSQPPPPLPGSPLYAPPGSLPPRRSIFEKTPSEEEHDEPLLEEYEDSPQEQEQNPPEPQRDTTSPPPQKPRRQRQRQLQDRMGSAQDRDQPPPLPRRSARIAGVKRPAEPLPSQAASNKKPRAAPKAAAPAAQPTTQETQRRKTSPSQRVSHQRSRRRLDPSEDGDA
ncbi:MAG: hypothetical protein M1839_006872 [Geoglossum umbratile]|nr:MAG: hypothetical protein M1839_006872 [Geoglossum umbratile]